MAICRGLLLEVEDKICRVFPVFMGLVGDLEAQRAALMAGGGCRSLRPDVSYMVPQEELDKLSPTLQRRKENDMFAVIQKAQRTVAAAAVRGANELREAKAAASDMLKKVSLNQALLDDPRVQKGVELCFTPPGGPILVAPALYFYPWTDVHELVAPDYLHTMSKGITDHVLNATKEDSVISVLAKPPGGARALAAVSALYLSH